MTPRFDPTRDLAISRLIRAPRAAVWDAWADPAKLCRWWIPAPLACQIVDFDLRPGGAFVTRMSEDGESFVPHIDGCFLDVVDGERLVFTNMLGPGWRPAAKGFITAVISFEDDAQGMRYAAHVMHADEAARQTHLDLGFDDGWGTVIGQLAALVERRMQ